MVKHCVPVSLRQEIRERISYELDARPMFMVLVLVAGVGLPASLAAYSLALVIG